MSGCSSSRIIAEQSLQEKCTTRQIIYTILVASCSITIGICLEWSWYVTDMETDDCAYYKCRYHSEMLKNVLYLGAIVSAGPAAFLGSLVGLKWTLLAGMTCTAIGSALIIDSDAMPGLYAGRVLHGLGAGFAFVVVPNYASEISRPRTRSVLIGFHYLCLLIGMLLSQTMANKYYIYYSYVNIATIAMAVLNLLALFFVADPPYYQLRGVKQLNFEQFREMCQVKNSNAYNRACMGVKECNISEESAQLHSMFTQCELRGPIVANFLLMLFQQFTGFNLLSAKLKCMYDTLNISETISDVAAVTLLQIVTCILCLSLVDLLRKKILLYISGFGMIVTLCLMNVTMLNDGLWLFCLITIYVISYSIGYGPIPWIFMPQLCPRKSRLWTSGFTVSLYALLCLINNQSLFKYPTVTIFGLDIVLIIFTVLTIIGTISFKYALSVYEPAAKKCIR